MVEDPSSGLQDPAHLHLNRVNDEMSAALPSPQQNRNRMDVHRRFEQEPFPEEACHIDAVAVSVGVAQASGSANRSPDDEAIQTSASRPQEAFIMELLSDEVGQLSDESLCRTSSSGVDLARTKENRTSMLRPHIGAAIQPSQCTQSPDKRKSHIPSSGLTAQKACSGTQISSSGSSWWCGVSTCKNISHSAAWQLKWQEMEEDIASVAHIGPVKVTGRPMRQSLRTSSPYRPGSQMDKEYKWLDMEVELEATTVRDQLCGRPLMC